MRKGWEIKRLGEVCDISAGGDVPKDDFSEFPTENRKIPIYANGEKNNGLYGYTSIAKVLKPSITVSARGTIGYAVKRLESFYPIVRLIVISPKSLQLLDLSYLDFMLKNIDFKSNGTSIPQLTVPMIKQYEIPIPPLPEQQRIVSILDEAFSSIEQAKENLQRNLQNAKELFQSELNSIFTNKGEGWEEKKLSEICEVKDGTHDSPKYISTGIPFVTQKNIREDGLSLENTKSITQTDHDKFFKRSNVTYGDILISMIGANRGMACIVDTKEIFSIKNVGLIKANENIDRNYLLYFLKSKKALNYIKSFSKGGAQEFIGLTELRKFPITLAPINHQQKIVQQLDKLSAETKRLEAMYQQKLDALEELKKSILQKAFSGELKIES